MSGHSKWSQIKRTKGAKDAKRGVLFSKLSKRISLAVKEGNSGDPGLNFKLRTEIEAAKAQGLPNDNIDRAIKKGLGQDGGAAIEEIIYEGYGPFGTAFLINTATDNRNRTVQSLKQLFIKNGGSLGNAGSVAWQFDTKGQILIEHQGNIDELELAAIDAGASDVRSSAEGLEVYTTPDQLHIVRQALETAGAQIVQAEIIKESNQSVDLDTKQQQQIEALIDLIKDDEDVIAVHTSAKL